MHQDFTLHRQQSPVKEADPVTNQKAGRYKRQAIPPVVVRFRGGRKGKGNCPKRMGTGNLTSRCRASGLEASEVEDSLCL